MHIIILVSEHPVLFPMSKYAAPASAVNARKKVETHIPRCTAFGPHSALATTRYIPRGADYNGIFLNLEI